MLKKDMSNSLKILRALWDKYAGHNDLLHGDTTRNMTSWEFVKLQTELDKDYILIPKKLIFDNPNDQELGNKVRNYQG